MSAWEVRNEGLNGTLPYAVERGEGRDAQVFVTGLVSLWDADLVAQALNDYEAAGPRYVYDEEGQR